MIRFVDQTGSTNADMAARLRGGESVSEGEWLVANRQTEGRGRRGRDWIDGAGNFMGSTVVHRRHGDPAPTSLALLAGLTVHEVLAQRDPDGEAAIILKWPNDVLAGAAKLGGILLEGIENAVVVGIGVNLVSAPELPDRKATCLSAFGIRVDRDSFAQDLARQFDLELERWRNVGLPPMLRRWQASAHPIGTALTVSEPGGGSTNGTFSGLTEDGGLQLRLADGSTRVIQSGEILLGEPGRARP